MLTGILLQNIYFLSEEEFNSLDLEDMKKYLIELTEKVPEKDIPELYEGIKQICDEWEKEKEAAKK